MVSDGEGGGEKAQDDSLAGMDGRREGGESTDADGLIGVTERSLRPPGGL